MANFQKHFIDAQLELKAICGPTMQQAGYHHANMLAAQLEATINTQGTDMLEMLQAIQLSEEGSNGDPHQVPEQ